MPELFDVHTPPDAWRKFATLFQPALHTERVAVADALERVLGRAVERAHDLPGFPRSTVDGYAVAAQDTYGASDGLPALLDVVGEVAMGEAAGVRLDEAQCALVHTGGMIPPDADAVVMVEHTRRVRFRRRNVSHCSGFPRFPIFPLLHRSLPPGRRRPERDPDWRGRAAGRAGAAGRSSDSPAGHRWAAGVGHR